MRDCKNCKHYKVCRDWYGNENGMPNFAEDIECKTYDSVLDDTNADMIKAMPDEILCRFLWFWAVRAVGSFLEHGGENLMNAQELGEWLKSKDHEIIVKTLMTGSEEE